jgi:DNA-binding response OmpR family regulator
MDGNRDAKSFPILLLTARKVDTEDRERFIATWSRADACMYKPFELDQLLHKMAELTGHLATRS